MELVIEVYEKKIQQLNELEKRVDREVAERMESFRKYKANIDELMDLMSKKQ